MCIRDRSKICPLLSGIKPAIIRNVVVLPHPDGPNIETKSPSFILKEMFFKMLFFPSYDLTKFLISKFAKIIPLFSKTINPNCFFD